MLSLLNPDVHTFTLRYTCSQYDSTLKEHGYVKVKYKETLLDPPAGEPAMLPVIYNEEGKKVMDPKGFLFIRENVQIDLQQPAPKEKWRLGDAHDAEGLQRRDYWHKSKVMSDILNHRMQDFTAEQKDQWRALNWFHNTYQTSDALPDMPLSLRAGKQHMHHPS